MAESKLFSITFREAPHEGKNIASVVEVDPNAIPTHPICLPGMECWGQDLHPSHPICLPGMGCWEPPPEQPPPIEQHVIAATVSSIPPGVTPPTAPSADAVCVIIYFGPGTLPTYAFVNPNVSTGPVDPTSK